MNSYS